MNQNKYLVAGIAALVALFGIGFYLNRNRDTAPLSNGTINQGTPAPTNMGTVDAPIPGRPQATITTSKGKFTIELRPDLAPKTVANYLDKFNTGYCNGKTFHRVEDWVVQGCDPKGDGTGGGDTLPTEISAGTFTTGAVGVARKAQPKDVSNDSQFFIVKKDSTFLDGEYTYFGHVISGMDVVNSLAIGDTIGAVDVLTK